LDLRELALTNEATVDKCLFNQFEDDADADSAPDSDSGTEAGSDAEAEANTGGGVDAAKVAVAAEDIGLVEVVVAKVVEMDAGLEIVLDLDLP